MGFHLKPRSACSIGSGIGTPVTAKRDYFGLGVAFHFSSSPSAAPTIAVN
jgi:hypothetical protein